MRVQPTRHVKTAIEGFDEVALHRSFCFDEAQRGILSLCPFCQRQDDELGLVAEVKLCEMAASDNKFFQGADGPRGRQIQISFDGRKPSGGSRRLR